MKICYHGTDKETAQLILKRGFRNGTYFAAHLEDALGFGGEYVFEVAFQQPPESWQFRSSKISPASIVSLKRHKIYAPLMENEKLRDKIFQSNLAARERKG